MTQPRCLRAGTLAMVTRRTLGRTHLLRPDKTMTNAYAYLLAWAASKHGVKVVAAVLMSTHEHLVVQAPGGPELADFLRDLHRMVALATKAYRKWNGAVWDHHKTSVVELRTPEALVEKLAYVMANPVAAGCVHKAALWPGLTTRPQQLGSTLMTAHRPTHFLDGESTQWPESLPLESSLPEAFDVEAAELRVHVAAELERAENEARREMKAKGWSWIGARKLVRVSPFSRARSVEPLNSRNPTFAVGRGQQRAFIEAVQNLRAFRQAYREALTLWRKGKRDVVFPVGTIAMVAVHCVSTAPG